MTGEASCKTVVYRKKGHLVRNLSIIAILGIISGIFLGLWTLSNQINPNLYNIDVTKLYDNVELIRNEARGKNPSELGAIKSCVLAFDNSFNSNSVKIIGEGSVDAMGFRQSINSCSIKVGDKIFTETKSAGSVVSAADRFFQEGNIVTHVKGSLSGNNASWGSGREEWTTKEYEEKMGGKLNEFMLYIVSSKTVKSSSGVEVVDGGNYKFTLKLDKVKSVVKYVKSMKQTGGLSSYPEFYEDISLTVTVDSNYRLVEVIANERYGARKAGIPITADSKGTLTNKFYYDGDFVIPKENEQIAI